ncbi:Plasmodium exported protein, unknown function, partial [Plasmodium berghei]
MSVFVPRSLSLNWLQHNAAISDIGIINRNPSVDITSYSRRSRLLTEKAGWSPFIKSAHVVTTAPPVKNVNKFASPTPSLKPQAKPAMVSKEFSLITTSHIQTRPGVIRPVIRNMQAKSDAPIATKNIQTTPPMIKKPAMPNKPASPIITPNVKAKPAAPNVQAKPAAPIVQAKPSATISTSNVHTKTAATISKSNVQVKPAAPNVQAKPSATISTSNVQTKTATTISKSNVQTKTAATISTSNVQTKTAATISKSNVQTKTAATISKSNVQTKTAATISTSNVQTKTAATIST